MKQLSRILLLALTFAVLGSLFLFVISYWMETSLTQQFVADSTELLKHPRFLKSVALAHCVFVLLCFLSACLLPKRLLAVNEALFGLLLYGAYFLTNGLLWLLLSSLHVIDQSDPFYFYIGSLEPIGIILSCLAVGVLEIYLIFWFRKRVLKQVP